MPLIELLHMDKIQIYFIRPTLFLQTPCSTLWCQVRDRCLSRLEAAALGTLCDDDKVWSHICSNYIKSFSLLILLITLLFYSSVQRIMYICVAGICSGVWQESV